MKMTLLTAGTLGDVHPYVAIGRGLQSKGHTVRIATHRSFKPLLDEYGLGFFPIEGDPRKILMGETGQKLLNTEKNPIAMMRHTIAAAEPVLHQVFDDYWKACQDADILLFHLLAALPAASIAEKLDVPAFPLYLQHVHHGGAGTTAAGLRAGVPSVIVPFFGDQPFWGWRVSELGVGPSPISRKKLTAESLARAINIAVNDESMKMRAEKLGETIRAERGVETAVKILCEHLTSG